MDGWQLGHRRDIETTEKQARGWTQTESGQSQPSARAAQRNAFSRKSPSISSSRESTALWRDEDRDEAGDLDGVSTLEALGQPGSRHGVVSKSATPTKSLLSLVFQRRPFQAPPPHPHEPRNELIPSPKNFA